MYSELKDLKRELEEIKKSQLNLGNIIQADHDEKKKQEMENCLQELKKYKDAINDNKNLLDDKSNSSDPCQEKLEKLKEELVSLKKMVVDSKQDNTKDNNNDRQCHDKELFNEIKAALQEKCKQLQKVELEKLKERNNGGGDNTDKGAVDYQKIIIALLTKLLNEQKNAKDKGDSKDKNTNDKDKNGGGRDGTDGIAEGTCVKRIAQFKQKIKDIDESSDPVNLKLQNLKNLLTLFDKEVEVPKPDQNTLSYF